MMRNRGVGTICFIIFLVCSVSLAQAVNPPFHRNFSNAKEDSIAIVSYLNDINILSNEALYYSYSANATINFNQLISIEYNKEYFEKSVEKEMQLKHNLPYAIETISDLYENMESYEYLIDDYILLKHLTDNISFVIENHSSMLFFFDQLSEMANNQTMNRQHIAEIVPLGYVSLFNCQHALRNIENILPKFSSSFSTSTLKNYHDLFTTLCSRYQMYFQQFLGIFPTLEPRLFFFVNKSTLYIGEQILGIGFLLSNNSFIENQQITIFFNDKSIEQVFTTDDGTFQTNISSVQAITPGIYSLWSETTYHEKTIKSDLISLSISLIPTFISFNLSQLNYYPGESILIQGNLTAIDNSGLEENITIRYGNYLQILKTTASGQFINVLPGITQCGNYTIQVEFFSKEKYASCESDIRNFYVDYPTILSLYVNNEKVTIGETIDIFGRLSNLTTDEPLSQKEIVLTVKNQTIAILETNDTGWYYFTWDTTNQPAGTINIYALFQTQNSSLRSSTAHTLPLLLQLSFFSSIINPILILLNQFFIPFILLLSLIFLLFIFIKYHKENDSVEKQPHTPSPPHPKQLFFTRTPEEKLTEQYKKITDLNQKIIHGYRLFIHRLIDQGVPILKSNTHLEIQQVMNQRGYPKDSVESVTITYEHARYAPYIAEEKDIITFDNTIFQLVQGENK